MRLRKRIFFPLILLFIILLMIGSLSFEMLTLSASSKYVLMIQQRLKELNYFSYKCTGSFGSMTREAVVRFQEASGLMADGVVGEETFYEMFSNNAVRAPIAANVKIPIGPSSNTEPPEFGSTGKWEDIDRIMLIDQTYTLLDLNTDKSLDIVRTGGKNHARIETATSSDTEIFLEIFGGKYNWSKRPVIVEINGTKYAASLQGIPQGEDFISDNDMDGTCALYFQNSASDITNLPDAEHRSVILRASGSGW